MSRFVRKGTMVTLPCLFSYVKRYSGFLTPPCQAVYFLYCFLTDLPPFPTLDVSPQANLRSHFMRKFVNYVTKIQSTQRALWVFIRRSGALCAKCPGASGAARYAGETISLKEKQCGGEHLHRTKKAPRDQPISGGYSLPKKPRRVCRPQAANKWNHFLPRRGPWTPWRISPPRRC